MRFDIFLVPYALRCQKCKLRTSYERFRLKRQKILQSKNETFSREHKYIQIRAVVFFTLPLLSCSVDEWLGFYYDSHTTLCHVPLSYSEWNGEDDRDPASDNCWSSTDHLQWIQIRLTRLKEQISLECRMHLLGLCISTLCDWLKKVTLLCQPIRCKIKTNGDLLAHIFPRFPSATTVYFEFWLVHWIALILFDWLK